MRCVRPLLPSVLILAASFHASPQSVLSVRSGVVHFSEGAVFIDDHALESKFGAFPNIQEGSTLRTEQGRAEILLTPACFLRLDENSAIRMISTSLVDTKIEFLHGSAILDSSKAPSAKGVLISYKGSEVRFVKQGLFRLDSEPAGVLQVYSGEASVTEDGKTSPVDTSHLFFFSGALETKKFSDGADDEFYRWAQDRSNSVDEENRLSAQTAGDPADLDNGQTIPINPNLNLGIPTYPVPGYGAPSYGGPLNTYGGPFNTFPVGGGLFGPFNAYNFGFYGAYPAFPPFLRYPANSFYSHWRERNRSSNGTNTVRSGHPTWNSTTGYPRPPQTIIPRPQTFVSRPVYVSPRAPTLAPHPMGVVGSRTAVAPPAAHPIGHR